MALLPRRHQHQPRCANVDLTTEIFRNWCISEPEQLERISYVIDEIHYLGRHRAGTTWEESILFAPRTLRSWACRHRSPTRTKWRTGSALCRGGNVVVIVEKRRRVPLAIRWILPDGRIVDEREARREVANLAEQLKVLRNMKRWMEE